MDYLARSSSVSVNRVGRERRTADGDVLRPCWRRRAVADPFTGMGNDGLPGLNVNDALFGLNPEQAGKHHRVFFKLRRLSWLDPPAGASHVSHADLRVPGVDSPDELVDDLGFVSGGSDARGFVYERWHRF